MVDFDGVCVVLCCVVEWFEGGGVCDDGGVDDDGGV